jgi:hypothetical protein
VSNLESGREKSGYVHPSEADKTPLNTPALVLRQEIIRLTVRRRCDCLLVSNLRSAITDFAMWPELQTQEYNNVSPPADCLEKKTMPVISQCVIHQLAAISLHPDINFVTTAQVSKEEGYQRPCCIGDWEGRNCRETEMHACTNNGNAGKRVSPGVSRKISGMQCQTSCMTSALGFGVLPR